MATPEQSASSTATASAETVVHRKARAGRAEHQSRAMSLAKALRLTIAKLADTTFDMTMGVISVRREVRARDEIDEALAMGGLRMVFDGPDRARAGIILDADTAASLIQQQTMGKVLPDTGGNERELTPTDAAVCAPFIEAVLSQAATLPETQDERQVLGGYRYGVWAEDARILGMALEAQDYNVLHIDLDIAGGVRQGHILLCMPILDPSGPVLASLTMDPEEPLDEPIAAPKFSDTVLNLESDVRICLAQVRMSLRDLGALNVGSVIDLGTARFDRVGIQTFAGQTIARGLLGQLDGQRAVQLQSPRPEQPGQFSAAAALSDSGGIQSPDALPGLDMDPLSDMPDLPPMPELEGGPVLPDLPELPDLPDLGEEPATPDLPELGDLPDLPDLPDLSDLPELDS